MKEKIREYVLKNYKNHFIKRRVLRDSGGRITKTTIQEVETIITIKETHIEVQNNKDASPIILSKDIL